MVTTEVGDGAKKELCKRTLVVTSHDHCCCIGVIGNGDNHVPNHLRCLKCIYSTLFRHLRDIKVCHLPEIARLNADNTLQKSSER